MGFQSNGKNFEVVIPSPQSAVELLRLALNKLLEGGTFLDAAICFMPDDAFTELTKLALEKFKANRKNKVAESILHYCSLQSVKSLHVHLDAIFELMPKCDTYYEFWPWHEYGKQHFAYLRNVLENDGVDAKLIERGWRCLILESLKF